MTGVTCDRRNVTGVMRDRCVAGVTCDRSDM